MSAQEMQVENKSAGSPFDLLDLYPETQPDFLVAWLDCLLWTLGSDKPNFLEAFTTETGVHPPRLARHPIEAMIDQATGHTPAVQVRTFLESYVPWFNESVWGTGADEESAA